MWSPLKRWAGEMTRSFRRPRVRSIEIGYEKAGLVVWRGPVPWNAEAALVEAQIDLPVGIRAEERDFILRGHGMRSHAPTQCDWRDGVLRVVFRLPPLPRSTGAEICWRDHPLEYVALAYARVEDFLGSLRLESPIVFGQIGMLSMPCQTLVAGQRIPLLAGGVLESASGLLPLLDLQPRVEISNATSGQKRSIPVYLSATQFTSPRALLAIPLPPTPDTPGPFLVRWIVGGRTLAEREVRVLAPDAFRRSLQAGGPAGPGAPGTERPVRPGDLSFVVSSREAGVVARSRLGIRVQFKGPSLLPHCLEQEVVMGDSAALVTIPGEGWQEIESVELSCEGHVLGSIPREIVPQARFNGEGAFVPAPAYSWTPFAEIELEERLQRLIQISSGASL
jgi:hypothetical protein